MVKIRYVWICWSKNGSENWISCIDGPYANSAVLVCPKIQAIWGLPAILLGHKAIGVKHDGRCLQNMQLHQFCKQITHT